MGQERIAGISWHQLYGRLGVEISVEMEGRGSMAGDLPADLSGADGVPAGVAAGMA